MDKTAFQAMWAAAPRLDPKAQGERVPRVTVNLPHRGTASLVESVLPLWLHQSVPVVVDVVDTGSDPSTIGQLQDTVARHEGSRLHTISPRAWKHPSESIALACDFSLMYAETEYVLYSHVDVFPHSRHLVHWLMDQCSAECPVVGYEISPRDHVVGYLSKVRKDNGKREWKGMVGHSLTMVHLPTIRAYRGLCWRYDEHFLKEFAYLEPHEFAGWDTEVSFNLWLRYYGVEPKIVGHDRNMEHFVDRWHGHARSYPGSLLFNHPHLAAACQWADVEVRQAATRLVQWVRPT